MTDIILTPRLRASLAATLNDAADAARDAIRPHFRKSTSVENKADGGRFDPVTVADRAAESAIRGVIRERYPEHTIVGEEFGTQHGSAEGGALTWVIDPIDGTRGFIAGAPTWGTLIGVGTDQAPWLGLMDQGHVGDRFLGLSGVSMSMGPRGVEMLCTSTVQRLDEAILAATAPEMFREPDELAGFARVSQAARLTRYGLDCTAYCLLAAGLIDLVVEARMKVYDIYPLIPIIEGAGGIVTDWKGAPVHQGGRVLAAATPQLHATAMTLLNDPE